MSACWKHKKIPYSRSDGGTEDFVFCGNGAMVYLSFSVTPAPTMTCFSLPFKKNPHTNLFTSTSLSLTLPNIPFKGYFFLCSYSILFYFFSIVMIWLWKIASRFSVIRRIIKNIIIPLLLSPLIITTRSSVQQQNPQKLQLEYVFIIQHSLHRTLLRFITFWIAITVERCYLHFYSDQFRNNLLFEITNHHRNICA